MVRRILQADHLPGALISTVVLAVFVNVIELLCTAGFPMLYTQILTAQQLSAWEYYGYLGLYNLAYIFDDGLMVAIAVVTLSRRKLQERAGRWLKLAGGSVMIGLGIVLLFHPQWLA
jgi:threonine/homoserine/homoserine lactone efflux protein